MAATPAVRAVDGDSLEDAEGTRYRLIGINAPDAPECLADEATDRLAELIEPGVALTTDVESEDQFERRLVYVHARPDGERTDGNGLINRRMVAEGLALAIHSQPNQVYEELLFAAQAEARNSRRGMWAQDACGSGPIARVEVSEVVWNPPGPDEDALDLEYVVLVNDAEDPVDLTGWIVRDESTQNRFTFPDGFVLGPGEEVTVTSGNGELGFGMDTPIWNNSGDTVLVLDDQGRIVGYLRVPNG